MKKGRSKADSINCDNDRGSNTDNDRSSGINSINSNNGHIIVVVIIAFIQ